MGALCCAELSELDETIGKMLTSLAVVYPVVDLRHFDLLRVVGKGSFGKKYRCIQMKAVTNILQERTLLEELEFPFLVNLRYAFQDDENLFMVSDLMLGGDLRFHLERHGPFKEDAMKLYVAEIALALNYLHQNNIIHRDIKPDNLLLDASGHVHLTDFNIAVRIDPSQPLKSIAGSMAYMAPEMLLKQGYSFSIDYWSLGVVFYELVFGKRPFRGKNNDMLTMSIVNEEGYIPANAEAIISSNCVDVMKRLLIRNVEKRLGAGSNFSLLTSHPFFDGIVWDASELKKTIAPFVPDSKKSNFDASHELEEMFIEDSPLRARERSTGRDYSKLPGGINGELSRQLQLMETAFTNYNFELKKRGPPKPSATGINNNNNNNVTAMSQESEPSHLNDTQHSEIMTDLSRQMKPSEILGTSWVSQFAVPP